MSGLRLNLGHLTLLIALAGATLPTACTGPNPNYCDDSRRCADPYVCASNHACVMSVDAANDGGDASVSKDALGDTAVDHPATTTDTAADRAETADGAAADTFDGHPGCVDNRGCTADPSKPVCERDGGTCVGCLGNSDCTMAGARACDTSTNKCVQCVVGSDCTDPTTPVCDNQSCRGCRVDTECTGVGPAVCMSHLDGHCATDAETVYVAKVNGCSDSDPAAGSSQLPFCTSQVGIDATAQSVDAGANIDAGDTSDGGGSDAAPQATKTLVVMRGPTPLADWSFNSAGRTITVVGQSNAMITPGAHIGIHVSDGTLYVRGLRVTGSTSDIGVVADGGELHLDRCMVDANQGGILIANATYDITNTVVANNMSAQTTGCGTWAGVCIVEKPLGSPGRFLNNTVVANKQVGVACDGAYPVLGSIVSGSGGNVDVFMCAVAACCGSGPTNIDPQTYHLMAGSSCIDKLAANMSTAYDIDGDPRPFGALSDCGADEYVAPMP